MRLPDGVEVCSRCGGTVLTQIQQPQRPQGQPVQGQRPQGQTQRQQGQPVQGQRPQRPAQRPQNPTGSRQPVKNSQINNHGTSSEVVQNISDDFFDDEFNGAIDNNAGTTGIDNTQQSNNGQTQNNQKKGKVKKPSSDGSSITDWLITMICLLVPCLNIWYIFKTLSKNSQSPDYKKTYIKAFLIYFVTMSILSVIVTMLFGDSIAYWIASTFLVNK